MVSRPPNCECLFQGQTFALEPSCAPQPVTAHMRAVLLSTRSPPQCLKCTHLACCRDDFIVTDNSCKARMGPKNAVEDIARTFEAVRGASVSAELSRHPTL